MFLFTAFMFAGIEANAQHIYNRAVTDVDSQYIYKREAIRPYIGLTMNLGVGIEDMETGIITQDRQIVRVSTGGGFALGVTGLAPVSGLWSVSGEVNYQFTTITPTLKNASGGFHHFNFIPSVKRAFPVGTSSNYIFVGAGPLFSIAPELEIDASEIPGGLDYGFKYKSSVGAVLSGEYARWIADQRICGVFGLRYAYIRHEADKMSLNGQEYSLNQEAHDILPDEMDKPDGSGIELTLSLIFKI